jgi:hypothetical protein
VAGKTHVVQRLQILLKSISVKLRWHLQPQTTSAVHMLDSRAVGEASRWQRLQMQVHGQVIWSTIKVRMSERTGFSSKNASGSW